jgi:hypothetical protein
VPKRKSKSVYIDTNVALDYATQRSKETIAVLDRIKEKGWKCISASFMAMEMADYKKQSLYVIEKLINKKWEARKVLSNVRNTDLDERQLDDAHNWFDEFISRYKQIEFYDFITDSDSWDFAQEISFGSNLTAPDVIHLTSVILAVRNKKCNTMITQDKNLIAEGDKILRAYKLKSKLSIKTVSQFRKTHFKKLKF